MFEFETSMSRPSAHELHMRARREQARVVNAFLSDAACKFVGWLGILARSAMKVARQLAAESRLRRDIRTLQQLHDRELSDMGLGRGEIERVVRHGRNPRAARVRRRYVPATVNRIAATR
jgi:uncharacterized protein YjiS (DUF1127 family)